MIRTCCKNMKIVWGFSELVLDEKIVYLNLGLIIRW